MSIIYINSIIWGWISELLADYRNQNSVNSNSKEMIKNKEEKLGKL